MSDSVVPQTACRLCGHTLIERDPVLDLGPLLVSAFPGGGVSTELVSAPLALAECPKCRLVQLTHTVHPRHLFEGDYWYASGINGLMREELRNVVREARMWARVKDGDWVLDTGANDGTLLSAWREHLWEGRPYRVAVEPSATFEPVLREVSECYVRDVFPAPNSFPADDAGKYTVITSIAMFYAVPDPVGFAQEVHRLLAPDGVWVVQMQDLENMVRATAFDNICHEHLAYYTVETFHEVCRRAGLFIVSVQPREINGGSLRFIVKKAQPGAAPVPPPITTPAVDWAAFQDRLADRVEQLRNLVATARGHGHTVDLLGASTKGNTLLQLAGLGSEHVRQCWERHPNKIGRATITGIRIVHEDAGRAAPPDLLVCPIWQFRVALIEREHAYLQAGGRIYFPLPYGELYSWTDEAYTERVGL